MQNRQELLLLHRMSCPYSAKVRDFVTARHFRSKIIFHDLENEPQAIKMLRDLTGDDQVPCLVINGKPLLESDVIIQWITENL